MADPTTEHADLRKVAENPRLVLVSRDAGPWLSKNLLSLLDDITRLRAENADLAKALEPFAEAAGSFAGELSSLFNRGFVRVELRHLRRAAEVLARTTGGGDHSPAELRAEARASSSVSSDGPAPATGGAE